MDWWHVVCMWGEPCSVFSLIVLIFYACACVRARSATNNRRSGDAPCGRVIKLYWYEIIHQCTLRWAFYLHILFSPADTVHFVASPGSGSVVNVRIIYVYIYLYKVLCIVILMAACCMEMISESSYIFNSCYSK